MKSSSDIRFFTIIELVLVIAIIAMLASMLLPALGKARDAARTSACVANMKQFSLVYLFYSNDNDDYLPCLNNLKPGGTNSYGQIVGAKNWLDDLVLLYLGNGQASANPAKVLRCPNEQVREDITTNYGLNYLIATNGSGGIKTTTFASQSQTGMLVENYGHLCYYCYAQNTTGTHATGSAYGINRAAFFRHQGGRRCVAAFLDGHVKQLAREEIPCVETYPDKDEATLKNTWFNMGKVQKDLPTVNGL